jgi:hypothetical protein
VRVARLVARAIGWLFVGVIAYHSALASIEGVQAASDGNWAHATELIAIAIVAAAVVIGALVAAMRSFTRKRSSRARLRRR